MDIEHAILGMFLAVYRTFAPLTTETRSRRARRMRSLPSAKVQHAFRSILFETCRHMAVLQLQPRLVATGVT